MQKDGKELLKIYDLSGSLIGIKERKEYYAEIKKQFKEKGNITTQVKTIRLILMNSNGKIYLQKRSKIKSANAGLYDKTVGGHVTKDYSNDLTVVKECSEELGFPAAVLNSEEFKQALSSTDLNIIGIFKEVDYIPNFESIRVKEDGKFFIQPQITYVYIGYYDGPIKFIDGECSGIEVFTLDELKKELKENSNKYTEDIKFMIDRYEKYLKPIEKILK